MPLPIDETSDFVPENANDDEAAFLVGSDVDFVFENDDAISSPSAADHVEAIPEPDCNTSRVTYICLTLDQVEQEAAVMIDETSEILGIDVDTTEYLLRRYQWQSANLAQDWIESSEKVLSKMEISLDTALMESQPENVEAGRRPRFHCPITTEEVPFSETDSLACGHRFSMECWRRYLQIAIQDEGAEPSLAKKCPMYKCGRLVSARMWRTYLSPQSFTKYQEFRRHGYKSPASVVPLPRLPQRRKTRCDCGSNVSRRPSSKQSSLVLSPQEDATCSCGTSFCLTCGEEPHSPIPCSIVRQWRIKNESEADNITWVLVHTKCCPGCKNPIEKNQGCMHMTCRCGYQFCWLCMGAWAKHNTNSFYSCNVYESNKVADPMAEAKEKARQSLERYAHYFERYRAHNHGQQVAMERQMPSVKTQIRLLHERFVFFSEAQFLEDAVLQIIECRRILKWSYAFGYFADWTGRPQAKVLFEDHQGELEKNLDRLQEMSETFDPNAYSEKQYAALLDFKMRLSNLTRVIHGFFRKMTEAFKTEFMSDDDAIPRLSSPTRTSQG